MSDRIKECFEGQIATHSNYLSNSDLKPKEICTRFGQTCKDKVEVKPLTNKPGRPRGRTNKKENTIPESNIIDTRGPECKSVGSALSSGRPKRKAAQVASAMITQCVRFSNDQQLKLWRPSGLSTDLLATFKLKAIEEVVLKNKKKESLALIVAEQAEIDKKDEKDMPPPAIPVKPKKGRARKIKTEVDSSDTDSKYSRITRSKSKSKVTDAQPVRNSRRKKKGDSDVLVLPVEPAPIIELLDSSLEESASKTCTQESYKLAQISPIPTRNNAGENENTDKENDKPTTTKSTDDVEKENKIVKPKEKTEDKKRTNRDSFSSEEDQHAKKRTKKATKTEENVPFISLENITIRKKPATALKKLKEKEQNKQKSKIPLYTKYNLLRPKTVHKQDTSTVSSSTDTIKIQRATKLTCTELIQKNYSKDEAQRKKAALINAKIEKSKRLREEKMLHAKKAREDKEKQKEEKLRQMLADKEEKHRGNVEKKKAHLAWKSKKAEEQRKMVVYNRIQRQKEEEENRRQQCSNTTT